MVVKRKTWKAYSRVSLLFILSLHSLSVSSPSQKMVMKKEGGRKTVAAENQ